MLYKIRGKWDIIFKNSFFPSTVIEWNMIDKNIRKLESLISLKYFKIYTAISKQYLVHGIYNWHITQKELNI